MSAGKRNRRVFFERNTGTTAADGSYSESWATFCVRWVQMSEHTGRELFVADQVRADVSIKVATDWDSQTKTITPKDRIRIKGTARVLNITAAVNVGEMNRTMEFACREPV